MIKNKKVIILIAFLIILIGGGILAVPRGLEYHEKNQLDAGLELQAALDRMANLSSFGYEIESCFKVDEREELISKVEGEKEGSNTHIKGEMVKTPVDIFYIEGDIYNYDSTSDKWMVIESGTSSTAELLISELKPLSYILFSDNQNISKTGFEKVDGQECLRVDCQPTMQNKLLDSIWKDFNCSLWIDYKENVIRKADFAALNRNNNKTKLEIKIVFYDFDEKISITPPDLTSKKK